MQGHVGDVSIQHLIVHHRDGNLGAGDGDIDHLVAAPNSQVDRLAGRPQNLLQDQVSGHTGHILAIDGDDHIFGPQSSCLGR